VDVDRGLIFAERDGYRALELDVYRPDGAAGRNGLHPLVVYIHGGGWRVSHRSRAPRETRAWARGFFERITDAGFVVSTPEYRFSAEAIFPAQLDDTVDAVRWLHANAADVGIDPGRTYLWGQSGGGLLAGLAGLVAGAPPVRGVVCWYGFTDLVALDHDADDTVEAMLLGGPIGERLELARAASPVTHVRPGAPPFLFQHGEGDTWVPHRQSIVLAEALRAVGVPAEVEIVPGADHFFDGSTDVEGIFGRALDFLGRLDGDSAG
jgi:acetyl esterase/lipase